jgi:hypothetical protein
LLEGAAYQHTAISASKADVLPAVGFLRGKSLCYVKVVGGLLCLALSLLMLDVHVQLCSVGNLNVVGIV